MKYREKFKKEMQILRDHRVLGWGETTEKYDLYNDYIRKIKYKHDNYCKIKTVEEYTCWDI